MCWGLLVTAEAAGCDNWWRCVQGRMAWLSQLQGVFLCPNRVLASFVGGSDLYVGLYV